MQGMKTLKHGYRTDHSGPVCRWSDVPDLRWIQQSPNKPMSLAQAESHVILYDFTNDSNKALCHEISSLYLCWIFQCIVFFGNHFWLFMATAFSD